MNDKTSDFVINFVLTILLVGILVLPIASVGLMGVGNSGDVLSGSVSNVSLDTKVGETNPTGILNQ